MSAIPMTLHKLAAITKMEIPTAQRLSRHIAKGENSKLAESVGCFVPKLEWSKVDTTIYTNQILQDAILDFLETKQDSLIRKVAESGRSPCEADISMDAVIELLESEAETNGSSRLTKESIGAWFDSALSDQLTLAFAEKLGISEDPTPEDDKRIAQMVKGYKDKLAMLAGGKTSFEPVIAEKLQKALMFVEPGDQIAERFNTRLEKMKIVKTEDLFAL